MHSLKKDVLLLLSFSYPIPIQFLVLFYSGPLSYSILILSYPFSPLLSYFAWYPILVLSYSGPLSYPILILYLSYPNPVIFSSLSYSILSPLSSPLLSSPILLGILSYASYPLLLYSILCFCNLSPFIIFSSILLRNLFNYIYFYLSPVKPSFLSRWKWVLSYPILLSLGG